MASKLKNIALALTSGTAQGGDLVYVAADAGDTDAKITLTELAAFVAAIVVGGGATAEIIRDTIGAALLQAAGITIAVNDGADTITIAADPELIRDTIGTALAGGQGITITVNDAGDTITIDVAPDIQAVVSSATVTPTFADDMVKITAQAAALNLANPTGTAVPGKGMAIRIKDNGTARAIAYNGGSGSKYRAIGVTLPVTTVVNKTLYLGMIYNADDDKWDVVAVAQEA